MSTPAIITIVLMSLSLLATAYLHGKPRTPNNFWLTLLSTVITLGLLLWGGYFK